MSKYIFIVLALMMTAPARGQTEPGRASAATQEALAELIASPRRPARHRARDQYRHPLETLTFCGIDPTSTVVEIWPGGQGGWYRRIIEPLMERGNGRYIPVTANRAFLAEERAVPYGGVDMVLVFRAHGFMIYDKPAQNYVNSLYDMLRPGGIFCIVDHAGDEATPQDPDGASGYVNESYFRSMAEQAGFVLLGASDINRNPKDSKDHPRGVYSLPPGLAGTRPGSAARGKFLDIGESDRFTHKYMKPASE